MEIRTASSFLDYYEKIRERTMRVVRCVPADRIDWTCRPGHWTLGDLCRHIALVESETFGECLQGRPSRYQDCGPAHGAALDEVVELMERLHRETTGMIARFSDEDMQAKCTSPAGVPITRWKLLRALTEHEIHHRGQLYVYLGILGVPTPSLFGLTERELAARST
jgi:uncharacterized damage-inducible protein DinB